jgi:hypothetical protein
MRMTTVMTQWVYSMSQNGANSSKMVDRTSGQHSTPRTDVNATRVEKMALGR